MVECHRQAGADFALPEEVVAEGVAIFEDWLADQPYGYEAVGSDILIRRVLSLAIRRTQTRHCGT